MDNWSPTAIAAFGAAGAVLIASFFAGIVSVITAWRTIVAKVTAIDAHVNSEKTDMQGKQTMLTRENELLRDMLNERKQVAALLAQAASHALAAQPPIPVSSPAVESSLARIDAHTEAIEENTKP